MKTIVVSGARSGIGKTRLAEELLRGLSNWSALKVTLSKDDGCPHERNCGICPEIKNPFYIIKEEGIINQPGKDTARLKAAGAKEVIWLKARPEGLNEGLHKALSEFSDCKGIVIEGTSVLKFIKPDLNLHISENKRGFTPLQTMYRGKKYKMSVTGFTLAELLLSAAILAFALSGLLLLFTNCIVLNGVNRNLAIASNHAQYIMEEIRGVGFTGLEVRINNNNGTPTGWDLNASQIGSAPYNLNALDSEAINTSVIQSGNPLGVSVLVSWRDRGQIERSFEARTLITNY